MANGFLNWLLGVPAPVEMAHNPGEWATHMERRMLEAQQAGDEEGLAFMRARAPQLNAASGYTAPDNAPPVVAVVPHEPGLIEASAALLEKGRQDYRALNQALKTKPKQ